MVFRRRHTKCDATGTVGPSPWPAKAAGNNLNPWETICNDLHFVGSWIYLYTTNWMNKKW